MDTPGKRIIKWRESLGLKANKFAELTGIPYTTLKTIESDSNKPSFDVLAKLRNAYPELNIDWLFDEGDGEPMKREDRALRRVTAAPEAEVKSPATIKRKHETPMAVVRDVEEMTPEEQAAYYKAMLELADEELAALKSVQRHEKAVQLVGSTGGRSFTDASSDTADTYEPAQMQVSYVAHDWQRFVAPKPAAYERRTVGFGAN